MKNLKTLFSFGCITLTSVLLFGCGEKDITPANKPDIKPKTIINTETPDASNSKSTEKVIENLETESDSILEEEKSIDDQLDALESLDL